MNIQGPALLDPTATQTSHVPPLPTFKHKNEDGQLVQSVKPMPAVLATDSMGNTLTKYYFLSMKASSMHREDGYRIGFLSIGATVAGGIHETALFHTQRYLDNEIAEGHPNLRHATDAEIQAFNMARDPRGTVLKEITPELEANLRIKILAELRAQGVAVPEERLSVSDEQKLAGATTAAEKLESLTRGHKVSDGKGASVVLESRAAPLKGIVSTASIASGAADSGV